MHRLIHTRIYDRKLKTTLKAHINSKFQMIQINISFKNSQI
jgi:hypothetical protein